MTTHSESTSSQNFEVQQGGNNASRVTVNKEVYYQNRKQELSQRPLGPSDLKV